MELGYASYTAQDKSECEFIIGTIMCTDVELKRLTLDKIKNYLGNRYGGDYNVIIYGELNYLKESKKQLLKHYIGQYEKHLLGTHVWAFKEAENGRKETMIVDHIKYSDL